MKTNAGNHSFVVRRGRTGFTLIEILVVVVIIVILVGIVVAVGGAVKRSSQERQTHLTLTALEQAMSLFLKDNPEPMDINWVDRLRAYPQSADTMKNLKMSANGKDVIDGYGNAIHYVPSNAATKQPNGFFKTYGIDGVNGNADDVFGHPVAPATN